MHTTCWMLKNICFNRVFERGLAVEIVQLQLHVPPCYRMGNGQWTINLWRVCSICKSDIYIEWSALAMQNTEYGFVGRQKERKKGTVNRTDLTLDTRYSRHMQNSEGVCTKVMRHINRRRIKISGHFQFHIRTNNNNNIKQCKYCLNIDTDFWNKKWKVNCSCICVFGVCLLSISWILDSRFWILDWEQGNFSVCYILCTKCRVNHQIIIRFIFKT